MDRKNITEEIINGFHSVKRKFAIEGQIMGKQCGITPVQASVLFTIKHRDGMSVKELADSLSVTRSAATQLVDGLVKNGLLLREDNTLDRRTVNLHLSEKSKKHMNMMKSRFMKRFTVIFNILSDDELLQLNKIIKTINNFENKKENN